MKKTSQQWHYPDKVDYRACLPECRYKTDTDKANAAFHKNVAHIAKALIKNLNNIDVVLTHDLLYLDHYLFYNAALRKAAGILKNIKWLHWTHSAPKKLLRKKRGYPYSLYFTQMVNSKFISISPAHNKNLAKMYGIPAKQLITIPNPGFNPDFMGMDGLSRRIIEDNGLYDADIVNVMPAPLNRGGKQFEVCIYLMAALKNEGKKVRLVFANPHNYTKDEKDGHINIMRLKWLANKTGLSDEEIIFTSEVDKRLHKGCPATVIRNLFQISNIFIHPSLAEACSLILMEAAATKNLCILNQGIKSFQEVARTDAVWINCGNIFEEIKKMYKIRKTSQGFSKYLYRYYLDKQPLYQKWAKEIITALDKNKSLSLFTRLKKEFNEKRILETKLKAAIEN